MERSRQAVAGSGARPSGVGAIASGPVGTRSPGGPPLCLPLIPSPGTPSHTGLTTLSVVPPRSVETPEDPVRSVTGTEQAGPSGVTTISTTVKDPPTRPTSSMGLWLCLFDSYVLHRVGWSLCSRKISPVGKGTLAINDVGPMRSSLFPERTGDGGRGVNL